MTSLRKRLVDGMKEALLANHYLRKRTLRGALARIQQAEIDMQTDLDETGIAIVLQKEVKAYQESIADAEIAARDDLGAEMRKRIEILQEFMPKQLSRDEISTLAKGVIAELGINSPDQMGAVMKHLMKQLHGQADGKLVSTIVLELLTGHG